MADEARGRLSDADQRVVDEAFRRGASIDDAVGILVARRVAAVGGQRQLSGAAPFYGDADARTVALLAPDGPGVPGTGLGPLVAEAHALFVVQVDDEFLTLEPAVMVAFTPLRGEAFAAAREKYRAMRAVYYRDGWRCPAEAIFAHIVPATFFGRPISGGVHRTLLPLLDKVEKHVRATNPEAARQMATETYSIGGFVPRSVAGQDDLSNHAFGLALDIDPTWNPMVKGPRAVAALERATGTRFGDWLFAASSVDALAQAYKRVAAASERLKAWLRRMLPLYDAERVMRADLAKAKGAAAQQAAKAKRRDLDAQVKTDPDRRALEDLVTLYGLPAVRSWADLGIVTVPASVVAAWVGADPNARWGGQYQHSKDMMHLEALAPKVLGRARSARVQGLTDLVAGDPRPPPPCVPVDWTAQPPGRIAPPR